MKRNWDPNPVSPYNGRTPVSTNDDAVWVHLPSHPYASAYSSLPNPFTPAAQQEYDPGGYAGQVDKKPRVSDLGEGSSGGRDGESDGDEEDDEDDDEDGEDGVGGNGTGGRGRGTGGTGASKQKVKLTRGSRWVILEQQ